MIKEIIEAIEFRYKNDEAYILECLEYLYENTGDYDLHDEILKWYDKHMYCSTCKEKLSYVEWTEPRPIGCETMSAYICPNCDCDLR